MEAERVEHLEIKLAAATALIDAIRRARAPCQTLPDGAIIRISKSTAYEPDVMVRCGPRLPRGTLEIPDPVIVVEVLSPSSAGRDYGEKVDGYLSVASVQHYLILVSDLASILWDSSSKSKRCLARSDGLANLRPEDSPQPTSPRRKFQRAMRAVVSRPDLVHGSSASSRSISAALSALNTRRTSSRPSPSGPAIRAIPRA